MSLISVTDSVTARDYPQLGPVYEARSGDGRLVRTMGKARVPRIANVLRKPDHGSIGRGSKHFGLSPIRHAIILS